MGVRIAGGPVGDGKQPRRAGDGGTVAIPDDAVDLAAMPLPLSTTWAVLGSLGADLAVADGALVVSRDLPGHRWCHAISVLDPGRVDDARHGSSPTCDGLRSGCPSDPTGSCGAGSRVRSCRA